MLFCPCIPFLFPYFECHLGIYNVFVRGVDEYKYDYYIPTDGSEDLLLVEKWQDEDVLAVHGKQPHFARLGELKTEFVNDTIIEKYFA